MLLTHKRKYTADVKLFLSVTMLPFVNNGQGLLFSKECKFGIVRKRKSTKRVLFFTQCKCKFRLKMVVNMIAYTQV